MTAPAFTFSPTKPADLPAIERLTERAFGPGRYAKTAYRLREGVAPAENLSFVARVGTLLVGANRLTEILIGHKSALLLGPLVVEPAFRQLGLGEQLIRISLDAAKVSGHRLVLLVGDEAYYQRSGFRPVPRGQITLPGPVDPARLLYCELVEGALADVSGRAARL